MITIREEIASDVPAREALLDRCLGERRTAKSSERLREGRLPAAGLALTAERDGAVALGGQRKACGRQPALAQALARLGGAALAEAAVEQRLAGRNIRSDFLADRDHDAPPAGAPANPQAFPAPRASAATTSRG